MSFERAWLEQRRHHDLDPRAERALRAAGLAYARDEVAEAHLCEAASIAPEHEAVLIAHYRYHLYKHRYDRALVHAQACVALAAGRLGVPADPLQVEWAELERKEREGRETAARFWLFACQAQAYVLLRAGQAQRGRALLEHLARVDVSNHSHSRELCAAVDKANAPDDD